MHQLAFRIPGIWDVVQQVSMFAMIAIPCIVLAGLATHWFLKKKTGRDMFIRESLLLPYVFYAVVFIIGLFQNRGQEVTHLIYSGFLLIPYTLLCMIGAAILSILVKTWRVSHKKAILFGILLLLAVFFSLVALGYRPSIKTPCKCPPNATSCVCVDEVEMG